MALTAVTMLFSCSSDSALRTVEANLANADPKSVTSSMTVTAPDGTVLPDMNATATDGSGNPAALNLIYYPSFSFDENGNAVIPEDYKAPIAGDAAAGGEITLGSLRFDPEYFKDEAYLIEEDRFFAVISDIEGFFGTPIDGVNEISLTIKFDQRYPTELTAVYTTAAKVTVSIHMFVTY